MEEAGLSAAHCPRYPILSDVGPESPRPNHIPASNRCATKVSLLPRLGGNVSSLCHFTPGRVFAFYVTPESDLFIHSFFPTFTVSIPIVSVFLYFTSHCPNFKIWSWDSFCSVSRFPCRFLTLIYLEHQTGVTMYI